ncbi:hypothetical protein ACVOMV_22685 [Mesorhizobium atlanticum]
MQEGLGWNWINVIHPEDLPGLVEHWGEIIKSARPDEHEASDAPIRWRVSMVFVALRAAAR